MSFFGQFKKPWLKRNYSRKVFWIKVSYIIKHLDPRDKKKIEGLVQFIRQEMWQDKKEKKVAEQLQEGYKPNDFAPIRLKLHHEREQFRIDDGVSKLRAFHRAKISYIKTELEVGEW